MREKLRAKFAGKAGLVEKRDLIFSAEGKQISYETYAKSLEEDEMPEGSVKNRLRLPGLSKIDSSCQVCRK